MGSRVERPNRVPGVPLCIFEAELAVVTGSQPEGIQRTDWIEITELGHNALNGSGAMQIDLTLRRQFKLRERLSLQGKRPKATVLTT